MDDLNSQVQKLALEEAKKRLNKRLAPLSELINKQREQIELIYRDGEISINVPDSYPNHLRDRILELAKGE